QARHRRQYRRRPGRSCVRRLQVANRSSSLVEGFGLETIPVNPESVSAASLLFLGYDSIDAAANFDHVHRGVLNVRELSVFRLLRLERNAGWLDRDAFSLSVYLDYVLHAECGAGISSQTVSPCAVCGNMSNARTLSIA